MVSVLHAKVIQFSVVWFFLLVVNGSTIHSQAAFILLSLDAHTHTHTYSPLLLFHIKLAELAVILHRSEERVNCEQ